MRHAMANVNSVLHERFALIHIAGQPYEDDEQAFLSMMVGNGEAPMRLPTAHHQRRGGTINRIAALRERRYGGIS